MVISSQARFLFKISPLLLVAVLSLGFTMESSTELELNQPPSRPLTATPPTLVRSFTPDTIGPGSATILRYDITNGPDLVQNVAFTDTLPAGIVLANPASGITDCTNGGVVAVDGTSTVSLLNARLEPNSTCTVRVNVIGTSTAMLAVLNLTSDAGSSLASTPTLTVDTGRPGFSKSFSPNSIPPAGQSTLTFTIDNTANGSDLSSLSFTDNLPAGLVIANPPNASHTCLEPFGVSFTAEPGTATLSYFVNGFLPAFPVLLAGASCTVSVDVTSDTYGTYDNVSELFDDSTSSGLAVARLNVPKNFLVKTFSDDPVKPGGTASLRFEINNLHRTDQATNISFTDNLESTLSGLTLASSANGVCNGTGSVSGSNPLSFSGGTLEPEASCVFTVIVNVPVGAAPGSHINTTSTATFNRGGGPVTENAAIDFLIVSPAPVVSKSFTDDPVVSGGTVTLEFNVTNPNPGSNMTDISFIDNLVSILPTMSSPTVTNTCGGTATFIPLFNPPPSSAVLASVQLTGGSLAARATCTISLVLDVSNDAATGTYPNTTTNPTATVGGNSYEGKAATDNLVVVGAPDFRKSFADIVVPGGTVDLVFELITSDNAPGTTTNIAFTDDLNAMGITGLTATGLPINACNGGTLSGTTSLSFSGGTLPAASSCVFTVTLQVPFGTVSGSYTNNADNVTADMLGLSTTGNAPSADLEVINLLFSKRFIGDPVLPGATLPLVFTVVNSNTVFTATNILFTDALNSVLSGLTATGVSGSCGAGSSFSGTSFLIFANGELAPGASCTVTATVLVPAGAASGTYNNSTGNLTANINGSTRVFGAATDELTVEKNVVLISKSFVPNSAFIGDNVTLVFSMTNRSTSSNATAIAFIDDLAAVVSGLSATGLPASSVCNGTGTLSGTTNLSFTAGQLGPGATCTFGVTLDIANPASAGNYTNTTSGVTGTMAGLALTGDPASADLTIIDPATSGQLIIDNITNPSGSPTSFDYIARGSPLGFIDVNFSLSDGTPPMAIGVVAGGIYTVTEIVPSGWVLANSACDDGSAINNIAVDAGETVTCTFTNRIIAFGDIYLPTVMKSAAPPLLPDLVVDNVTVTPVSGNTYSIQITARNQSSTPVTPGNNFFVNVYLTSDLNTPILVCGVQGVDFGAGQSFTCPTQNYTFSSGSHTLRGWADPFNTVLESNESNNTRDTAVINIAGSAGGLQSQENPVLPSGVLPTPTPRP